jgi:hypothetical protein
MEAKYWTGDVGECDGCHQRLDLGLMFYDIRTKAGPWGKFCTTCAKEHGIKDHEGSIVLGKGFGQLYLRQTGLENTGKYQKIDG